MPFIVFSQDYKHINGYKYLGKLTPPEGYSIQPGQFSKDMKKYYLPATDTNGNAYLLIYLINNKGQATLVSRHLIEIPEGKVFAGQSSLTEDEKTMVFTVTSDNSWSNNELCVAELETRNKSYTKTRLLGELNEEENADAYPFISSDGLRIYWIRNNQLFFASRMERNHAFKIGNSKISSDKKMNSFSISNDELIIYYVESDKVFSGSRKDIKANFENIKSITEGFQEVGFIAAYSEIKGSLVSVFLACDIAEDEYEEEIIVFYKKK